MKKIFAIWCILISAPAFSQISLSAGNEPTEKAWRKPATLAYVRNGDGSSITAIDAYLKYTVENTRLAKTISAPAVKENWSVAAYLDKDTGGSTRKNDRGGVLGYTRMTDTNYAGEGPVMSLSWNARLSVGKSLQLIDDKAPVQQFVDKTKDRQLLTATAYFQPRKTAELTGEENVALPSAGRHSDMFLLMEAGLYSDHNSGGAANGGGRLSGGLASIEWNFLPLGMVASNNKIAGYGVAPVFTLAAQVQHDTSASGMRKKDTYKLYTAMLTLEFNTIFVDKDDKSVIGRLKPSLSVSRTVGADLLGGRPYEAKTEVAFGLTF